MNNRLLKPERIVCDCYGITVDDIRNEIKKGNCSFEAMVACIRLGVLCSACIEDAKSVINAILEEEYLAENNLQ